MGSYSVSPSHTRRGAPALAVAAALLVSVVPTSPGEGALRRPASPFTGHKGVDWDPWVGWRSESGYNWAAVESDLDDLRGAGVAWVRTEVEYGIDALDPWPLDHLVGLLRSRGMSMLAKVRKNPPLTDLCDEGADGPVDPGRCAADRDAYREWLAAVAGRHQGFIRYWEIGNEPNLEQFWRIPHNRTDSHDYVRGVRNYILHLEDSYRTIKAVSPELQVLIGGVSEWRGERYIRELAAQGGGRWFDVLALHPYAATPDGVLERLETLRAAAWPVFGDKPVWVTEVGFHAEGSGFPYPGRTPSEEVKADYLRETFVRLREAGVEGPIFWYDLSEHATSSSGSRAGYGLQHVESVEPLVKTNLPAYDAMRGLPSR